MPVNKDYLFERPVPGQSLTTAPGSMPYEQPPQYVTEDEAMYFMLDRLTSKEVAPAIKHALKKGVYASDITNGLLLKSFADGKITPDTAALIAKKTLGAVVAVGTAQGLNIKDIKVKKPSKKQRQLAVLLAEDGDLYAEGTGGNIEPEEVTADPYAEGTYGMDTPEEVSPRALTGEIEAGDQAIIEGPKKGPMSE